MTHAIPARKFKYLKTGERASEARRSIVESSNPAYRLLPYYYIFDKSNKRPYWFHDLHQAFLLRPLGSINLISLYLIIKLLNSGQLGLAQQALEAGLILPYSKILNDKFILDSYKLGRFDLLFAQPEIHYSNYRAFLSHIGSNSVSNILIHLQRYFPTDLEYFVRESCAIYVINNIEKLFDLGRFTDLLFANDSSFNDFNSSTGIKKRIFVDSYWLFSIGHMCNIFEIMQENLLSNDKKSLIILRDPYSDIVFDTKIYHCSSNIYNLNSLSLSTPIFINGAYDTTASGDTVKHIQLKNFSKIKNYFSAKNSPELIDTLYPSCKVSNSTILAKYNLPDKYVLLHPRTNTFRGGSGGARDTDTKLFNILLSKLIEYGHKFLFLGIDKGIVGNPDDVIFAEDLNINGTPDLLRVISQASFNLGSLSGPTHIAACFNIPTIYFDCPWPLSDFMNNATFYARNLNSYNSNIFESLKTWYTLSLETIDTDTSYMPIDYSIQSIEYLALVISQCIRCSNSFSFDSTSIRHDFLYNYSEKYKNIFHLYEDFQSRSKRELCHPADLIDWFIEVPELMSRI